MYARFSGAKGFTPEDLRAAAAELAGPRAGAELRQWFALVLDSTQEMDYQEALDWFGLQFKPAPQKPRVWLGVRTRLDGQRTIVSEVRRGSPASDAGLDINDELVAVDDVDVGGRLAERLATFTPGRKVALTIVRRGAAQRIDVTLGADPAEQWLVAAGSDPTQDQNSHLKRWLQD
jgi:predicted metalloprotease with PDZ domain